MLPEIGACVINPPYIGQCKEKNIAEEN